MAVVIVTFNGSAWIEACIASALEQSLLPEIIVVDNASTDGTVAKIRDQFPTVNVVEIGENLGFGRANNVGICRALQSGAEYLFLLNQDAYLLTETLGALVGHMAQSPEVGVCAPMHCSPDANHLDHKTYRGYLQLHAHTWFDDLANNREKFSYRIFGVNAAGWLVRSSVFVELGGFDPLFFMYGEDDDLLQRWAYHGVKFDLIPSLRLVHLRQSPVIPAVRAAEAIWRLSQRSRSELLGAVKRPGFSLVQMLATLLVEGFVRPIVEVCIRRNWKELVAGELAAWRVLLQVRSVVAHCRLTERRGSHFLKSK